MILGGISMNPLILDIPVIAVTGSNGKTTTREFIAAIIEQKWEILKNTGNKNLPNNTQQIAESYNPSVDAIVLELGMGKQGAGEKHCSHVQPNISIITNVATAHYGNLGNSIESTARFKSALIKHMKPDGMLLINNDDENSKLLDTSTFKGRIITVGTDKQSDYNAKDIKYVKGGMKFTVTLDDQQLALFIPTFGLHNIHNALFAVAVSHEMGFTPSEIREGLAKFQVPIKRLNIMELSNQSLLIDDTVNANPQSVKAAIDVQEKLGKGKKKIVVLGSMLELGDHTEEGHKEIGTYLTHKQVDAIFTYGKGAKWIKEGAIDAGYDPNKVIHFKHRSDMHRELKNSIEDSSSILVKGSSAMNMIKTVKYIKDRYFYSIKVSNKDKKFSLMSLDKTVKYLKDRFFYLIKHSNKDENLIYLNSQTLQHLDIKTAYIKLHFGQLTKKLKISINNKLKTGEIIVPQRLSEHITIPPLPYEYYFMNNQLFLGPVIGMVVYQRYMNDPNQQLLRFANYSKIKGLIFLFSPDLLNKQNKTISGYYYDPKTKSFIWGTFPLPCAIFNRIPLRKSRYKFLKKHLGDTIFNYPYGNSNKLEFWNIMSKQAVIRNHLPRTKEYKNVNSLLKSLKSCDSVYLKPATMAGGNGIFHVKKINKGYLWSDILGKQIEIKSKDALAQTLKDNLVKNKTYIVQKEIPTFNEKQNKIDFRIYLQKDYTKNWRFSGIETKVGQKNSIIANSKNRKSIIPGEQALKKFYGLNEDETKQKIEEMTQVCIRTLKVMEKTGSKLGDACLDLVMDKNRKFWILEPQINYAAEIKSARDEGERRVLPLILPTPFEYAKVLSGF